MTFIRVLCIILILNHLIVGATNAMEGPSWLSLLMMLPVGFLVGHWWIEQETFEIGDE